MKSHPFFKTPTILFDFGCILVGLSKQRCIDALQKIGCGRIAYYVDECRQEDLFHDLEVGGSIEAFCEEARRQSAFTDEMGVFHPCNASDEDICWAWNELLTGVPVEKLRAVKALKERGFRTAILSNTNEIHWKKSVKDFFTIDGLTVNDYFDDIFLSCDLGMVKPDREIYDAVIERLGCPASDITFVDDSKKNCLAAEKLGIRTLHDPKGQKWMATGTAAIIGNFDGVHLGHQHVIEQLTREAELRNLTTLAITFDKHPRAIFDSSFVGSYILPSEEKIPELKKAGLDDVLMLSFTQELAGVTAFDFMKNLRDEMGVKLLLLGYDNRFGKRSANEGFQQYMEYGKELGIEVLQASSTSFQDGDDTVTPSSSLIRKLIMAGEMEAANKCLGRPYAITGIVSHGYQEGRKIGFPTANIQTAPDKLLPANGVYATRAWIGGKGYQAVTNIGTRPTYDGSTISVETHVLGMEEDLYGSTLRIELLRKIRDERPFSSPEELKEQIKKDIEEI